MTLKLLLALNILLILLLFYSLKRDKNTPPQFVIAWTQMFTCFLFSRKASRGVVNCCSVSTAVLPKGFLYTVVCGPGASRSSLLNSFLYTECTYGCINIRPHHNLLSGVAVTT